MKIDVLPIQMCPEKLTFNKQMDIKTLMMGQLEVIDK